MKKPSRAFNKRFYTVAGILVAAREILDHLDDLLTARRRGRISRAFAEKIMLAVTQVNDCRYCRYCRYGHLHMALQAGVSELEIQYPLISSLVNELGVLFLGVTLLPLGAVTWAAKRGFSRLAIRRAAFEN